MGITAWMLKTLYRQSNSCSQKIDERFFKSGLGTVCKQLVAIAHQARAGCAWIAKPIISLRIVAWVLMAVIIAGLGETIMRLEQEF
jgi:hypothetical protein